MLTSKARPLWESIPKLKFDVPEQGRIRSNAYLTYTTHHWLSDNVYVFSDLFVCNNTNVIRNSLSHGGSSPNAALRAQCPCGTLTLSAQSIQWLGYDDLHFWLISSPQTFIIGFLRVTMSFSVDSLHKVSRVYRKGIPSHVCDRLRAV